MPTRQQLETQYIQDRAFWGSIGGRWRGLAGGLLVGGLLGLGVGLIAAAGFSAISGIAFAEMGKASLLGIVGFMGTAGMLVGANLWSNAGQISGAVATGLMAQKELELQKSHELQKEIDTTGISKPAAPPAPLINWKVSAMGAVASGMVGAALAYSGALPASAGYTLFGQQAGTAMGALAAGVTFGTFGTVFGMAFKPFQMIKQWTDGLFEGRASGRSIPEATHIKACVHAHQQEQDIAQPTPLTDQKKPSSDYWRNLADKRSPEAPILDI